MPNSFTPGPWFIEDNDRAISSNAATDIALVNMANIRYGWDGPDFLTASHRAANARLIAAAPELLEALTRLEFAAQCRDHTLGDPCRLLEVKAELAAAAEQARAAIAKAKGAV